MSHGRRTGVPSLAIAALASILLAGCAGRPTGPPPSPALNDPILDAASMKITPIMERSYPETFAGIRLDLQRHVMIVYRRPDPSLDATVRSTIPGVHMEFRDARFSLAEMKRAVDRVMTDVRYWADQGIHVHGAGPTADGSGILVSTSADDPDPT